MVNICKFFVGHNSKELIQRIYPQSKQELDCSVVNTIKLVCIMGTAQLATSQAIRTRSIVDLPSSAGVACGREHRTQNGALAEGRPRGPYLENKNPLFNRETGLVSSIHTFLDSRA